MKGSDHTSGRIRNKAKEVISSEGRLEVEESGSCLSSHPSDNMPSTLSQEPL